MRKFVSFGPSLAAMTAALVVLVVSPLLVRRVTDAHTEARVMLARQSLADDDILERINRATRAVAQAVEPSVVHLTTPGRYGRSSSGSGWSCGRWSAAPMAERRMFALLGHPVRHSVSPVMHSAAFRALDLPHVYSAFDVPTEDDLRQLIDELRSGAFAGARRAKDGRQLGPQIGERKRRPIAVAGEANLRDFHP